MNYTISKNKFSASGFHFGINFGRVNQTYKVRFDSSCLYDDTQDWERDWNKLVGWSLSNTPIKVNDKWHPPHHRDSVRFVWRSNRRKQVIELALYYYQDGIRYVIEFCEIPADRDVVLSIVLKEEYVTLVAVCKEESISIVKPVTLPKPFKAIWSYKLYPYFGGNNPAWNTMKLSVTEV